MKSLKEILAVAETLAQFANLQESDVETFRAVSPGFVPEGWWTIYGRFWQTFHDGKRTQNRVWQDWQSLLREAWEVGFPPDAAITLLVSQATTEASVDPDMLDIFSQPGFRVRKSLPYQHAVMFLTINPWRADFCRMCQEYFVRAKPGDRFCSPACFQESRRRTKRQWWSAHGSKLRKKKSHHAGPVRSPICRSGGQD